MAKRYVYFGLVAIVDKDGIERNALQGEQIDVDQAQEKRLDELGALYPKSWDPHDEANAEAAERQAPDGADSALDAARLQIGQREARISELEQELIQARAAQVAPEVLEEHERTKGELEQATDRLRAADEQFAAQAEAHEAEIKELTEKHAEELAAAKKAAAPKGAAATPSK